MSVPTPTAAPDSVPSSSVDPSAASPQVDIPGQLALEGLSEPGPPHPVDASPELRSPSSWFTVRNVVIGSDSVWARCPTRGPGARPLHHDESLDAWFSWRFLNGTYDGYDPVYHGPLRFYLTAGVFWAIGESEATARLLAAVTGAAVVALPWFWRRDLGRVGVVAAVG